MELFYWIRNRIVDWLWYHEPAESSYKEHIKSTLKVAYLVLQDVFSTQITLRAMGLVYQSCLAAIPLIILTLAVLSAFGLHQQIEPVLLQIMSPLGDDGTKLVSTIINFVEDINAGVLGMLGMLFLLYLVGKLIHRVESVFNYIWQTRRQTGLIRHVAEYMVLLVLGPALIMFAFLFSAATENIDVFLKLNEFWLFEKVEPLLASLMSYLMVCVAFFLLYIFIPAVKVYWRSALVGALLASLIWESMGWAYTVYVTTASRYIVVYAAFASLILLLIWMYISWLILLFGSIVSFYLQYPERRKPFLRKSWFNASDLEKIGIKLLVSYFTEAKSHKADEYFLQEGVSHEVLHALQRCFIAAGFIAQDGFIGFVPAQAAEQINLAQVLKTVRNCGNLDKIAGMFDMQQVNRIVAEIEPATQARLQSITLADILLTENQPAKQDNTNTEIRET